jgi:electron transport complex protein RnfG
MKVKIVKPTLIALVCAILLALSHQQSAQVIKDNKQYYEQQILREMVPGSDVREVGDHYQIIKDGDAVGVITATMTDAGYNGDIHLLVAHDGYGKVLAVRVTQHQETPGLGDKIDHRVSNWINGFSNRSIQNSNWSLAPRGDFDAITGATITSRATLRAVKQVLEP